MPSGTPPAPIALVVCDNVYREAGGKTALVGLFNEIRGREFPLVHPHLSIYASVTDIRPGTKLKLEIANAESGDIVARLEGPPLEGASPVSVCEMVFNLRNLSFREPGRYDIRFYGNDSILVQRPFQVVKTSPDGGSL